MTFELDELQLKDLKEWQEKIKDLFGEYGSFEYTFIPTGIGDKVLIKSSLTGLILDVSHEERW